MKMRQCDFFIVRRMVGLWRSSRACCGGMD